MVVGAASPARNWIVSCEARRDSDGDGRLEVRVGPHGELLGDALDPLLIEHDGRETPIDQFLGNDPSGRYVAYRSATSSWLLDTTTRHRVNLTDHGLDTRDDARSYTTHRALSFDPFGRTLAYLRRHTDRQSLVLRELASGGEDEFPLEATVVGRIAFEPDGRFIRVDLVTRDSNGNGRVQWPYPEARGKRGPCPGPIPQFNVWQWPGDDASPHLFDIAAGQLRHVEGFVMTVGGGVITRKDNRELWLEQSNGESRRISSEKCSGRVLHVDAEQGAVLFGCAGAWGARRQMYARLRDRRVGLDFDLAGFEVDGRVDGHPWWIPLYPRNESLLLAVASADVYRLAPETRVLATHASSALVDEGGKLTFVYLDHTQSGPPRLQRRTTERRRAPLQGLLQRERFVSVGSDLFDLQELAYLGQFGAPPSYLSRDGLGLTARTPGDATRLAYGPLTWSRAQPR